jgi:hypothetical protein
MRTFLHSPGMKNVSHQWWPPGRSPRAASFVLDVVSPSTGWHLFTDFKFVEEQIARSRWCGTHRFCVIMREQQSASSSSMKNAIERTEKGCRPGGRTTTCSSSMRRTVPHWSSHRWVGCLEWNEITRQDVGTNDSFLFIYWHRLHIYIGIERFRPFKEVTIGETFGSVGEWTSLLKWTHEYFITLLKFSKLFFNREIWCGMRWFIEYLELFFRRERWCDMLFKILELFSMEKGDMTWGDFLYF